MLDDIKYPEPDPNKRPVAEVWNERYAGDSYLFGKEPCLSLRNNVPFLKKGRTLDVAMGEGRNAVFLAKQGFQVEGCDASQKGIEKAKALAAAQGTSIETKVQNLDFFLMPLMKYDTVIMTYFRPMPRFFSEVRRGLVAGGTFLLEAYLVDQIRIAPNPLVEFADCYKPNEVLGLLRDFQVLHYREIPEGNAHIVQALARKTQN
ncbi:MAG: class I SAM-dependent methyltransferase [Deltaproteobacteria bacterium]|nr:class I SAM-dependent methyltransferase [Deltaproteobacteria bacterium]MBI3294219.1 class I SAM-dependent methyltransferase [Deltaproteobacteria bacterium]